MLTDEEIMAQVLAAFQEEEAEHRQAITDILLELEREPNHPKYRELIDQLFREAHSLKGGARAAGQDAVEQISHRMEDVFSAVRQGKIELVPNVCDVLYAATDAVGVLMGEVQAGRVALLAPHQAVLDNLTRILQEHTKQLIAPTPEPTSPITLTPETAPAPVPEAAAHPTTPILDDVPDAPPTRATPPPQLDNAVPAPAPAPVLSSSPPDPSPPITIATAPYQQSTSEQHWDAVSTVRLATTTLDNLLNETGELITCSVRAQQRATEARALADMLVRWRRVWRQVRPQLNRMQAFRRELQPTVHHLNDRDIDTASSFTMRTTKLIDNNDETQFNALTAHIPLLLDALTQANNLISDLENNLSHHARQSSEDHTRLATVTDRLHDQIRRTRMLPLNTLFSPLRLQVRDIARASDKQVDLALDDEGAEADRQVLERLRDVLLHLLRNGIDHGIELPDVRLQQGKSAVGHIILRAAVSGDYLTIHIEDDGAGLDLEAIKQRAIANGLMSEADLARVTETELIDYIFLPGFSTRQTVSKMSGRGVGLDIVRSQVERMHGRVTVQNFTGKGTIFTVSVPLSLTSSHGLLLRIDQATYMLPLDSVQRIVAVAPGDIKVLEGRACLVYDKRPLALVHLADLLGKNDRPHMGMHDERSALAMKGHQAIVGGRSSSAGGWSLALLLGSGERQVACMVDGVLGEQELVVYRLPAPLQRVRFIAGATILADGSVVPILDVVDVVRTAIGSRYTISQHTDDDNTPERRTRVLVVDDSITTRTLEKNILEAAGYEVTLATDGIEALESLRRLVDNGGCDLLLSDIDMPRLNGFELTTHVRNDTLFKHIPIVLVTSLDTPADRERGIAAGADAYIVKKAFDQQTLLDTIEQLI